MATSLVARGAVQADLAALQRINPDKPPAIHRDRLRDVREGCIRYLILEQHGTIVGYGVLVFKRPPYWSDASDRTNLPQAVNLYIQPSERGQGFGTALLRALEAEAASAGADRLFIGVDPIENPRAYALYARLGYTPLEPGPSRAHWRFTDSEGRSHEGSYWNINLVRELTAASA